ncbi:similar to Saccharomyces cerevisiae YBR151W APD1 Protein of unknown function, required for normal localization of actin patches and for normal tolerance of sodium ions and hydrogen peroxide [Maudiozyma barnettii]|uniref:Actin patches distal protein 1 n=1 Tax=Maudiozyma barnettii TaxID=61262 RepID=A0A8H2ZFN1_9SACH|nr:Apd1p [Kazachstania barnettii]CAB4253616.1 similar to Saccharomyces cerevisiae YBR151W APD1 Protein of unknown function, required for normal localization of actin patches and for normal tolerance of sodium ions and hydrogen peroxide [Kazachstania barnettii]CAD1781292.1 similar to Saccharomyces cerevisiae YBR151W APD1 Protein of unknown function, required for normal localization of actin patches and for normal tolerance of sodium ions and hydrogen peroxide [Kazachstania barnettii]
MGITDFIKGDRPLVSKAEADQVNAVALAEIQKEIQVCNNEKDDDETGSECSGGCDSEDMEKGEAVFSKLQIDYDTPLLNSSKSPKLHFIVPTSKIDWAHDACMQDVDSIEYKISKWCESHMEQYEKIGEGQTLTCSVTSQPINIMDIDVMRHKKNNVLILPYFIWINDLKSDQVDKTLDKLVPIILNKELTKKQVIERFPNVSLATDKSFVFICSHTTRDKRCGVTAPYMKKVMDKLLQTHGLYRDNSDFRPDGCRVSFINHVGGHKFAGNVQIYLRDTQTLIWLGRVTPKFLPTIFEHLILPENPTLPLPEKVRCVRKYEKW